MFQLLTAVTPLALRNTLFLAPDLNHVNYPSVCVLVLLHVCVWFRKSRSRAWQALSRDFVLLMCKFRIFALVQWLWFTVSWYHWNPKNKDCANKGKCSHSFLLLMWTIVHVWLLPALDQTAFGIEKISLCYIVLYRLYSVCILYLIHTNNILSVM